MKLERAVYAFITANEVEGKSPNTISFYQAILNVFIRWIRTVGIGTVELRNITATHIREYLRYLQTEHIPYGEGHPLHKSGNRLSPYGIKAHWATLSAFFNWAQQEGLIDENPMVRIARPKIPKKLKQGFTVEEIQKLLNVCRAKGGKRAARDIAIILFLLDTGCRISEVCQCRLEDVDLKTGRVKVRGKGAKERFVYIGQKTKQALLKYISKFRPQPQEGNWLFLTHDGRKMTRFGMASLLARLGREAGIQKVHAHRFRHTMAIQFLRNGGDIFTLQRLLGHTTLDMVKEYLNILDADVEQTYRRASPVDNWKLK